jgi:prenyltransferase beta subunit
LHLVGGQRPPSEAIAHDLEFLRKNRALALQIAAACVGRGKFAHSMREKAIVFLRSVQNTDGGFGGCSAYAGCALTRQLLEIR